MLALKAVTPRSPVAQGVLHAALAQWADFEDDTKDQEVVEMTLSHLPNKVTQILIMGIIPAAYQRKGVR